MNITDKLNLARAVAACSNTLRKTSFAIIEPASEKPNLNRDRIEIVFALSTRQAEQVGVERFGMKNCTALGFETREDYQQIVKMLKAIPLKGENNAEL